MSLVTVLMAAMTGFVLLAPVAMAAVLVTRQQVRPQVATVTREVSEATDIAAPGLPRAA